MYCRTKYQLETTNQTTDHGNLQEQTAEHNRGSTKATNTKATQPFSTKLKPLAPFTWLVLTASL